MLIVGGCASQKYERVPTNYFLFNQDEKSGLWRSRYDDFVEIAKAYVKQNAIPFDFEGTSAILWVLQEKGALVARVEFGRGLGSPCLSVDINTAGRPVSHYTGTWHE